MQVKAASCSKKDDANKTICCEKRGANGTTFLLKMTQAETFLVSACLTFSPKTVKGSSRRDKTENV